MLSVGMMTINGIYYRSPAGFCPYAPIARHIRIRLAYLLIAPRGANTAVQSHAFPCAGLHAEWPLSWCLNRWHTCLLAFVPSRLIPLNRTLCDRLATAHDHMEAVEEWNRNRDPHIYDSGYLAAASNCMNFAEE